MNKTAKKLMGMAGVFIFFAGGVFMSAKSKAKNGTDAKQNYPGSLPFSFSARPAEGSASDVSFLNSEISEKTRVTVGKDGHLYSDGKRIKFFATNISSIPEKKDAAYWAQVLAAQGYNCIRFHHIDSDWGNVIFKYDWSTKKRTLNEEGIDRFDYFFAQLKKRGIYANINLLTGRTFSQSDNLPAEVEQISEWKAQHELAAWNAQALQAQKDYAKLIFHHKNPYTGLTYAQDPAVAIFEVNNENSFPMSYKLGYFDDYPASLYEELNEKWTRWLYKNGWTYEKMANEFVVKEDKQEIFSGSQNLNFESHGSSKIKSQKTDTGFSIKVLQNGTENWHVQSSYGSFKSESDTYYTIRFRARASKAADLTLSIGMAHEPWAGLGLWQTLKLTNQWQDFEFFTNSLIDDDRARISFSGMGLMKGTTFEFEDFCFEKGIDLCFVEKTGGKTEISDGEIDTRGTASRAGGADFLETVAFPKSTQFGQLPEDYRQIVTDFIYETDRDYWLGMKDYVKNELGVQALSCGTALPCGPYSIMSEFDILDTHHYFNHPVFPNASWDNNNFYVSNKNMASTDFCSDMGDVARSRIYGKPFSCSEFDNPYPSQFSSEMIPIVATIAALQDWDCIYTFAYEANQPDEKDIKISSYFDNANNPVKAAACPLAAMIFRQGKVSPAKNRYYFSLTYGKEKALFEKSTNGWNLFPFDEFKIPKALGIVSQIGIVMGESEEDCRKKAESLGLDNYLNFAQPDQKKSQSDNGEVFWDGDSDSFMVDSDDAFILVSQKNGKVAFAPVAGQNADSLSKMGLVFTPSYSDYAVFAGVKVSDGKYLIFSGCWSGGKGENLHEYGKDEKYKEPYRVIRDNVNLTCLLGKSVAALGSEGKVCFGDENAKLYSLDQNGKIKKEIKKSSADGAGVWEISSKDQSLWYLLTVE